MKKAVFFDVDGTLIDAAHGMTHMSRRVKDALRRMQTAGHLAFIASGRPYAFLDHALKAFGFDGYVLMNGAAVILHDQVIYEKPLEPALVKRICALCDASGIEYVLQGTKHVYLKPEFQRLRQFYRRLEIPEEGFVDRFDIEKLHVSKFEFIAPDKNAQAACLSLAKEDVVLMEDSYVRANFELYSRAENKATGIAHALKCLGLSTAASFAFGDGRNDLEMLGAVGCSFAMGNADETVKKAANYVLPSVREDGVAEGIERYILADV